MSSKIDLTQIDAIIFDLGGVILNLDYNLTINAFKELGKENFDQLYTQANQDRIFDQYEVGDISSNDFIKYMQSFIDEEVSDQVIIDAWNIMLLDLPEHRIELLNKLKTEKRIFLYSNTNDLHYKSFKKHLKDRFNNQNILEETFEIAYYSHILRKRKPHPTSFLHIVHENDLNASRTLFIDDSIQHIEGASEAGLQTYHLVNEDIINIFDGLTP